MLLIVFIVGSTGSGKTDLAQFLFKDVFDYLVNSDSRHFYSELSVGTGKPSQQDCILYGYKMVGFLGLRDFYNPYCYIQDCLPLLETHPNRVCVVGGSLFYVSSILNGLPESAITPGTIKEKILQQYKIDGLCSLLLDLSIKDPECFKKIDQSNPRRVLRALEFIETTGTKFSLFKEKEKKKLQKDYIVINPFIPRKTLYERINTRVCKMLQSGWEEEVLLLHKKNLLIEPIPAIGYDQVLKKILGKISLDECVAMIQQKTRNLAKRQMTWIKKMAKIIHWIDKETIQQSKLDRPEDCWIHSKNLLTPEKFLDTDFENNISSFQLCCTKNELKNLLSRR